MTGARSNFGGDADGRTPFKGDDIYTDAQKSEGGENTGRDVCVCVCVCWGGGKKGGGVYEMGAGKSSRVKKKCPNTTQYQKS